MIGHNQLNLNTASVMEALQEYLDKRMGEHAPKVVSLNCTLTHGSDTYCVGVESAEGKSEESGK